jgi:hypothetical protein
MISNICGTIQDGPNVDFIITSHVVTVETAAIVVKSAWIHALFASDTFIDPFGFCMNQTPPVENSKVAAK